MVTIALYVFVFEILTT